MANSQAAKNKEFMEKINLMPIHQAAVALFAVDGEKLIWNINTPPFRMKGAEVRGEWQYVAGYAMRKQELYDFRRYSRAMPTEGRNVKRDDFDAFVREQKKAEKAEKPPKQKTAGQRHSELSERIEALSKDIAELSGAVAELSLIIRGITNNQE